MLVNRNHAPFPRKIRPAIPPCYASSSASFLGIAATIAGLAIITTNTIAIKTSCMEQAPKNGNTAGLIPFPDAAHTGSGSHSTNMDLANAMYR
jgi:hypothetical protein